jgi:hypothetical protein
VESEGRKALSNSQTLEKAAAAASLTTAVYLRLLLAHVQGSPVSLEDSISEIGTVYSKFLSQVEEGSPSKVDSEVSRVAAIPLDSRLTSPQALVGSTLDGRYKI